MNTEALLAEYKELKQEQRMRMTSRDNLGYWIFPALAVIGGVALSGPGREPLLPLVPLVCIALGWAYLGNDTKVTQIGDYIHTELAPALGEPDEAAPFGWETYYRVTPLRTVTKVIHPVVQLMIFCAPGLAALIILFAQIGDSWNGAVPATPVVLLGTLESALIGMLTALFITHGWFAPHTTVPRSDPPLLPMELPVDGEVIL